MTAREITAAYLRRSTAAGPLRRLASTVELSDLMRATVGDRVFSRPLFFDRAEMDAFHADAAEVFRLVTSLPERLFDGDLFAYCAALRIPFELVPPLLRGYGREPVPRYGRVDMYHDGAALRMLEFNVDSEIGGVDQAGELARGFARADAFREFAAGRSIGYVHPAECLARALRHAARAVTGATDPLVALVEIKPPGSEPDPEWLSLADVMARIGVHMRVVRIDDLAERSGRLVLDGAPVDVVMRGFSVHDLVTAPGARAAAEPVFQAHERDAVVVWTPPQSMLYLNKGCLAMLSDPRHAAAFTAAERAVVDRVVPWTRALDADTDPELIGLALADRADLVLKPTMQYGGIGVVAGWECTDEEWRAAVDKGAAAGSVLQRRVVPRDEPAVDPDTGAVEQWQAAYGMFTAPDGYAGAFARVLPADLSAVIGVSANARTRLAGVFLS